MRAVVTPSSRAWAVKLWSLSCRLAVASDQPSVEFAKKTDRIARTDGLGFRFLHHGALPAAGLLNPAERRCDQLRAVPRQRGRHLEVGVGAGERPCAAA